MSRHTETLRRLTEVRDVVTSLVAGEADRGSLEDEVARIVAGSAGGEGRPGNARPGAPADGGRHAGGNGQPDGQPALSTAQRPGLPGSATSAPGTARPTSAHGAAPGNGQHQVRPQPGPALGLQGPLASSPAAPDGPSGPADGPSAAPPVSSRPAPAGTPPTLPVAPTRVPGRVLPTGPEADLPAPKSPSRRSDGAPPREVDDTAADLKAITE
jgi:hypothetical protein